MFSGYHNDPKKTAEVLIDGWCHTGDAVNINEKGHLIFLDRLDHMGELGRVSNTRRSTSKAGCVSVPILKTRWSSAAKTATM